MVVETQRVTPYAVELNEKTFDIFVGILEQLNLHLAVFLLFITFRLFDFVFRSMCVGEFPILQVRDFELQLLVINKRMNEFLRRKLGF